MTEIIGRGAWSSIGTGGTLKRNKDQTTAPGPYYMLAVSDNLYDIVGLRAYVNRSEGRPVSYNMNAVFHAVVGIQFLCNYRIKSTLNPDGVFGTSTDKVVRKVQSAEGLAVDGIVGRNTMKALLRPVIMDTAKRLNEPWEPIYGIVENESAWDPGAVGKVDFQDLGLAQINTVAHPEVSFAQAFCPSFAINFVGSYIRVSLDNLNNNLRDAVASYNLGIGGTRQWIAAGRPDIWTPPWAVNYGERNVKAYIDRILNAAKV